MSNSTTDHAYKPNGYGVDKCLLCGEKITEHLTPMTLPDDIELREKLAKLEVYTTVKSEKHPLYYKDIEAILEFIATYRKKWETEADRKTLEAIYAILNGDDNQVETAKAYIWNKHKRYDLS